MAKPQDFDDRAQKNSSRFPRSYFKAKMRDENYQVILANFIKGVRLSVLPGERAASHLGPTAQSIVCESLTTLTA